MQPFDMDGNAEYKCMIQEKTGSLEPVFCLPFIFLRNRKHYIDKQKNGKREKRDCIFV